MSLSHDRDGRGRKYGRGSEDGQPGAHHEVQRQDVGRTGERLHEEPSSQRHGGESDGSRHEGVCHGERGEAADSSDEFARGQIVPATPKEDQRGHGL